LKKLADFRGREVRSAPGETQLHEPEVGIHVGPSADPDCSGKARVRGHFVFALVVNDALGAKRAMQYNLTVRRH